jgi:hypothetical protein
MRRATLQKPLKKPNSRRIREEAEDGASERPEVRKDIARVWWPEGP